MKNSKNLFIWLAIILFLMAIFNSFQDPSSMRQSSKLSYSEFLNNISSGDVSSVLLRGNKVSGKLKDGRRFSVYAPDNSDIVPELRKYGVKISAAPKEDEEFSLIGVLISWFPMLLLIGVWIFFMRQMQSGNGKAMSFGKSKAKMMNEDLPKVTFKDVAGVEEAKDDLEEIIDFLKDPSKFQRLGGKIPKGVLLIGPPGTGKTLLARAVAGEANVPFFTISGSDFVEMFVGVGASRVRDMFEQGKKNAPCLIFIDEIDAVGRHRGAGLGGGNDEREQTLNQLLVEMDGFETNEGVILIAATNRPDVLDPALLRPGRFDRQVAVPNPDIAGREQILEVHMRKTPIAPDVDARVIARGTPGFSGADLANLVNEAALLAARRNKRLVTMKEFDYAKDKVLMGAERRTMIIDDDEKKLTAYHEAGHALCGLNVEETDPIHKATIVPRGRALGLVQQLPEKDQVSYTITKLKSRLIIAMGGRVAEELVFGAKKITSGASSDIAHATKIARSMVTEWGMSEELGAVSYGEQENEVFLGRSVTQHKSVSDETTRKIDLEVKKLIDDAYNKAKEILTTKRENLDAIAQALIEFETLTGEEINKLVKGEKIEKEEDKPKSNVRTSVPVIDEEEEAEKIKQEKEEKAEEKKKKEKEEENNDKEENKDEK